MICHPAERDLAPEAGDGLGRLAERVLSAYPLGGGRVQAVFTTDEHMARLNGEYRGKQATTDVLSFDYGPSTDAGLESVEDETEWTRGEIYISVEQAAGQARDRGVALTAALGRLLVHGLLHLSGYDHQTTVELQEMEALTDSFLQASGYGEQS